MNVVPARAIFLLLAGVMTATHAHAQDPTATPTEPASTPQPPPSTPATTASLAVFPMQSEGLQQNEVARLSAALRKHAQAFSGLVVQDEKTTVDLLEGSQSLGLSCDLQQPACAATFGKLVDVDNVMLAQLVSDGDGIGLEMRVISVAGTAVRERVRARIPQDPDAQDDAVASAVKVAFGQQPAGTAAVVVDVAGGTLFIDGIAVGEVPLTNAVPGLTSGMHTLAVKQKGYYAATQQLMVDPREPRIITLTMVQNPDEVVVEKSAFQKVAPWTLAGAGGALAIGGTVSMLVGKDPYDRFQAAEEARKSAKPEDPGFVALVEKEYKKSDQAVEDWNGYGQAAVVTGAVLTSIGTAAIIGGLAWGIISVASDDEGEAPAPAPAAAPAPSASPTPSPATPGAASTR